MTNLSETDAKSPNPNTLLLRLTELEHNKQNLEWTLDKAIKEALESQLEFKVHLFAAHINNDGGTLFIVVPVESEHLLNDRLLRIGAVLSELLNMTIYHDETALARAASSSIEWKFWARPKR